MKVMETTADDRTFTRSLAAMKRRGSNLLVVGSAVEAVRNAASQRFLGDGVSESRRRLFVFTDAAYTDVGVGTGPTTPQTTRVVTRTTPTRSAASVDVSPTETATPSPTHPGDIARRRVDTDSLGKLAWAIEREISAFERDAGSFAPGELRLCFDSLAPLLSTNETPSVQRFLRAIGNRVHAEAGMAHYHLPVTRADPVVDDIAHLFDATIELRLSGGVPEHRWILHDEAFESGWLPL